ncbi:Sec14p-like phosphatidylinositol transfer family protein [Striga hermonthica]|uniref:Sec14p-like phosphatidylinositol transfer family protein n=1 Tax=Striga hermonthica TaxID=68872 RepID=A0A9N7NA59_STRHE|nr:Sec14p-like phosphatidylinositol transfer family protein [Striga hermonthica]
MSQCLRLRPPWAHHFNELSRVQCAKPRKVCRLTVRSCSSAPQNTRKLVAEVKEKLEKEHNNLPIGKYGRDDEEMILWFLKDRRFSVDEAVSKLTKAIRWRKEFGVSGLSEESVSRSAKTEEIEYNIYIYIYIYAKYIRKGLIFMLYLGLLCKFDAFYCYYPRRLGQVLFVDAPFIFKPIWGLVKPLVKSYASLVRFCTAKDVKEEYFTVNTVPASFRE